MELDWSTQSSHIRTLFRPWQPSDGYDEAILQAEEARLDLRLPATLRTFYRAWGGRKDLTQRYHFLAKPDELVMKADTLILATENQVVAYWGVRREVLEESDPPVIVTPSGPSGWEVESELDWTPSHTHLSGFLNDLTYLHAFCGGAVHGAWTRPTFPDPQAQQIAWLEEHWNKVDVGPLCYNLIPSGSDHESTLPLLYVRDGQALKWLLGCGVAARETGIVDEIGQRFQLTWAHRW